MGDWLLRGLAVVALAALIMLGMLVAPLPEPTPVTPTAGGASTPTPRPTAAAPATESPTSAPLPTITPLFTRTSTPTPTPTATPTSPPTDTATPTPTATSTSTPIPAPSSMASDMPGEPDYDLVGRIEQRVYPSQVTGGEAAYRVYLPPDYDQSEQRYPVLYLLHGWPYNAADWERVGAVITADLSIEAGTLPPFIIVLPRGSEQIYINTAGGDYSFEGQMVTDLIPHIDATYRTQAQREGRAIGGISRGGVWALEISFRHPDLFSTVGAHSPALSANRAPPVYDPFNLMREPGVESLRIYLSAGDRDWAWKSTEALHEALIEQGIANEFAMHTGVHATSLWAENVAEYLTFYAANW